MPQESILVPQESILVPQESILVPQESILVPHKSILVPQESILVPQESILEDSEVDSGLNSRVGFKNVDFPLVFQGFWAATAGSTAPAQNPAQRAGPPRGGFMSPFFHLKNPIAKRY